MNTFIDNFTSEQLIITIFIGSMAIIGLLLQTVCSSKDEHIKPSDHSKPNKLSELLRNRKLNERLNELQRDGTCIKLLQHNTVLHELQNMEDTISSLKRQLSDQTKQNNMLHRNIQKLSQTPPLMDKTISDLKRDLRQSARELSIQVKQNAMLHQKLSDLSDDPSRISNLERDLRATTRVCVKLQDEISSMITVYFSEQGKKIHSNIKCSRLSNQYIVGNVCANTYEFLAKNKMLCTECPDSDSDSDSDSDYESQG